MPTQLPLVRGTPPRADRLGTLVSIGAIVLMLVISTIALMLPNQGP